MSATTDILGHFDALTSATSQPDAVRVTYNSVEIASATTPHGLSPSGGNFTTKPGQSGDSYDISGEGGSGDPSDTDCDQILSYMAGPPPLYSDPVRITISIVLICVPILTVLGNGVVILAVIKHKRLRTLTNAFVVSLAGSDACVALFVMPFPIYQQINNREWLLGETMCKLASSLDVMLCTVSIFHLACLAWDRYLAICRPFLHERVSVRLVSFILVMCWIIPVIISFIPIFNDWNLIGIEDMMQCAFPKEANVCAFIENLSYAIISSSISFYIPAVFMCVCYWRIYLAAIKQAQQIRTLEEAVGYNYYNKSKFKHESKAAKTLGIIMGCFLVCWLPFFIFLIIDPLIHYSIPFVPWQIVLWLGYINSLMNPLLYYNFNRNFYHAFRRMQLSCKGCKGVRDYDEDMFTMKIQMSE